MLRFVGAHVAVADTGAFAGTCTITFALSLAVARPSGAGLPGGSARGSG
jgi:hypothetical protein